MKYLSEISSGKIVGILRIEGGMELRARLAAMGINVGQRLTIISNGYPGPFVLRVKDSKMVLGRGMANKIIVSEITL
jgi:Fe2+ transport system protein FeoA